MNFLVVLYFQRLQFMDVYGANFVILFIPRHIIVAGYYGFTCVCQSVRFSFPDDNLSKHQWIFTKLGMCIDIMDIWFEIANGQISSNFYAVICPRHAHIFIS